MYSKRVIARQATSKVISCKNLLQATHGGISC